MRVFVLFSLLSLVNIYADKEVRKEKCCAENEQLDAVVEKCVALANDSLANDLLRNLKKSISKYFTNSSDESGDNILLSFNSFLRSDVTLTRAYETETYFTVHNFEGVYRDVFGDDKRDCFDNSANENRPRVHLISVKLKPIYKCCSDNERLNIFGNECEPIEGKLKRGVEEEIIDLTNNTEVTGWIPETLFGRVVKVKYRFLKHPDAYAWSTIARENSDVRWKEIKTPPSASAMIAIKKINDSAYATDGATNLFCFDEVYEGPLAPRAILAATYDVHKCCEKGMHLDHYSSACVPRSGTSMNKEVQVEVVDWQNSTQESYWIPESLQNKSIAVKYGSFHLVSGHYIVIYDEGTWTLERGVIANPELILNVTYLSGRSIVKRITEFCFEYIDGAAKVLLVKEDEEYGFRFVMKCCYPGYLLSVNGNCIKHNGSDWTPGTSDLATRFDPQKVASELLLLPLNIVCPRFHFESTNSSRVKRYFGGEPGIVERFQFYGYCIDQSLTHDEVQEVVVSCLVLPHSHLYENIRPVGVVSAILLAVAAIVAMSQKDTRRSAHGRALACHALCLSFANALQVTWFFITIGLDDEDCALYSYSIYFLISAANFWLTSITVNMAHGFRKPLETNSNKGGRAVWRRFGLMSLFSWGGSLALTAFTVTMHIKRIEIPEMGLITPTFLETRTCAFETTFHRILTNNSSRRFGSLLYYYTPMALLMVINGICVFLTTRTIRYLQQDTKFLKKDSANMRSLISRHTIQNVLLYAKLLLSAGIVELALEILTWAFGRRNTPEANPNASFFAYFNPIDRAFVYTIVTTFLDLARAFTVFWLCLGRQGLCMEVAWGRVKALFQTVWEGETKEERTKSVTLE